MIDSPREGYKKIAEVIEKKVYKLKPAKIIFLGTLVVALSLFLFMVAKWRTDQGVINGMELVFKYGMMSATTFVILHVLTVLVLLLPIIPDKFQFATLFTLINIPLSFAIYAEVEAKMKVISYKANLAVLCFFCLMFCWILFGLEATRRESKLAIFRFWGKINAWIQKKYDEGKF